MSATESFVIYTLLLCMCDLTTSLFFQVNVKRLLVDNKMILASNFGKEKDSAQDLELSEAEEQMIVELRKIWTGILNSEIAEDTDFFQSGGGSMDIVRYGLWIAFYS